MADLLFKFLPVLLALLLLLSLRVCILSIIISWARLLWLREGLGQDSFSTKKEAGGGHGGRFISGKLALLQRHFSICKANTDGNKGEEKSYLGIDILLHKCYPVFHSTVKNPVKVFFLFTSPPFLSQTHLIKLLPLSWLFSVTTDSTLLNQSLLCHHSLVASATFNTVNNSSSWSIFFFWPTGYLTLYPTTSLATSQSSLLDFQIIMIPRNYSLVLSSSTIPVG